MLPELIRPGASARGHLISALVHSEIDDDEGHGRTLTVDEIVGFVSSSRWPGRDGRAPARLRAVELARNPDRWHPRRRARRDPNAVEETLRYEARRRSRPVGGRDVEIHGQVVQRGVEDGTDREARRSADRSTTAALRGDVLVRVRSTVPRVRLRDAFCSEPALARLEGRIGSRSSSRAFPRWRSPRTTSTDPHVDGAGYTSGPSRLRLTAPIVEGGWPTGEVVMTRGEVTALELVEIVSSSEAATRADVGAHLARGDQVESRACRHGATAE